MYIRKVIKKSKNKERVVYRLVESYRTPNGPRQRRLLTLKNFTLEEKYWKELADAIEAKLKGQMILFLDKEIDFLSDLYSEEIKQQRLSERRIIDSVLVDEEPEFEYVDIRKIKNRRARTIGAEHIALSIFRELELDKKFKELGFNERQQNLASLSIIGRLVHPASENATREWAKNISGLEQLLNYSFKDISNNSLYRISDKILEHKKELEEHLTQKENDIFNLKESLVFYDLTNTYYEGQAIRNGKAEFGHSKQKRSDCRLITLGLVIDEHGFPKASKVMKGNQYEPHSLIEMIAELENRNVEDIKNSKHQKKNKTIIMDAGLSTKENLEMLKEYGYDYICVARSKPLSDENIKSAKLKKIRETRNNSIEVELFREPEENILYCRSFLKGKKEQAMLEQYKRRFESELEAVKSSLSKKRGTKRYDKVLERIGRIKERNSAIAKYYIINVIKDNSSNKAVDISWELSDFERESFDFSGSYFIKTTRDDLNEIELWNIYSMLTQVESAFRSLKSELAFRPVFHHREDRSEAHLFIAVLAYHLLNTIRIKLQREDIHISWKRLRKLMSTQISVMTELHTKDEKTILIQQATEPEYFHKEIYKALNIRSKPLKRIITKM